MPGGGFLERSSRSSNSSGPVLPKRTNVCLIRLRCSSYICTTKEQRPRKKEGIAVSGGWAFPTYNQRQHFRYYDEHIPFSFGCQLSLRYAMPPNVVRFLRMEGCCSFPILELWPWNTGLTRRSPNWPTLYRMNLSVNTDGLFLIRPVLRPTYTTWIRSC